MSMMLPTSVRRVATSAPQAPSLSSLTSAVSRSAISYTFSGRPARHQRRWSSSKPSSPDNGAKDISSVPASAQTKATGEKRKRKAKESPASKLPSVPSTQHLPLDSLALASFFSQHRPISITHSLPKTITDDAFASIFLPRTRGQKNSDVMDTLSRTVQQLETPMASLTLQDGAEQVEENMQKIELKHPDGTESSLYVQVNAMSGQFLPFQPPPLPRPETDAEAAAAETAMEEQQHHEEPHHRVYKAVLTIEEQMDADGQIKVVAHSPQIIEEPAGPPRSFLERMAVRHLKYEEAARHRERMLAISVKRQKKLKMKKKKYKKLMRRTRNERRRLDRI